MQRAIKKKKKVDRGDRNKMGIFSGRRTSWTTITSEVNDKENETIDSDFVRKNSTEMGVDVLIEADIDKNMKYECLARVEPLPDDSSLYSIRLATNHQAFKHKTSCTIRSFSSFYFLQRTLTSSHPTITVPSLPPKPLLWVANNKTKVQEIANFISSVISNHSLIISKVLQLFLQTQLSIEFIQENLDGKRSDQISPEKVLTKENSAKNENICASMKGLFQDRKRKSYVDHILFMKDKPMQALIEDSTHDVKI